MTREEREDAIDIIQSILNKYEEDECLVTEIPIGDEDIKAFKMAIEALEQEPRKDEVILTKEEYGELVSNEFDNGYAKGYREALEQEPCEDTISRKSIKQKLQEHHDFFVNAYGGFSNLPQNDKSRVDEITNCIAMVVNEPSVTPQEPIAWIVGKNNAKIAVKNMPIDKLQKICAIIGDEQEPILDKIREEIKVMTSNRGFLSCSVGYIHKEIDNVFDKYKAESENL